MRWLPNINPRKLGRGLALRTAQRTAEREIWPFLKIIGEARFRSLIGRDEPFFGRHLTMDKMPDRWRGWLEMAPQYKFMVDLLTDDDVKSLLPGWLIALCNESDQGKTWLQREIDWLKKKIKGA